MGNFLVSALECFTSIERAVGVEIDGDLVQRAESTLVEQGYGSRAEVRHEDFYQADWTRIVHELPEPLLIIGNPPWVTNSELGTFGGNNLPSKSNLHGHRGIDAITGKSNFDISEWMLNESLTWIHNRRGLLAMLCKTSVARKVLRRAWKTGKRPHRAEVFLFDTRTHFHVHVDACLLVIEYPPGRNDSHSTVYEGLQDQRSRTIWGVREGHLVSDLEAFERWRHLAGDNCPLWRSGIKHDCAAVMELREHEGYYLNGMGETVDIEPDYLYPLVKSADLAVTRNGTPRRWMVVTQRSVGQDTGEIRTTAPKTWEYLQRHAERLERRRSSVFRNRPKFALFGVGEYAFTPWKVAISGLYKTLAFHAVGPFRGRRVVFDDTCYFLSCLSKREAEHTAHLMNSRPAREFLSSLIFWDDKRPITASVLRRLDRAALARELGLT